MTERCNNCRFWDAYPEGAYPTVIGDCRRRAPRISDELLRRTMPGYASDQFDELESSLYPASTFPVTHTEGWCGEYERLGGEVPL